MSRALLIALVLSVGPAVSNSFARFAYALVLPAMREQLAMDYAAAGWLNTANAIGYLVGAIGTRLLVARTGNKPLFAWGMFVTAIAVLATGLSHDVTTLALWRLLAGMGGAAVFICGGALSAHIATDRPDQAMTMIAVYFAGGGIGLILCGVTIPVLLAQAGPQAWPSAWIGMGLVAVAMSVASLWALARIDEPAPAAATASAPTGAGSLSGFVPAGVAYLLFGLGYIGYMTFIIAWLRQNGASTTDVVLMWSLLGVTTLAAPILWRGPLARWRGGRPMAAVMSVLALGAGLPLLAADSITILVSGALFGAAMFSVPSAIQSLVKKGLPARDWGSAMAVFTIVFAAGQIVGPVAAGRLADLLGTLAPGLGASVGALVLGALLALAQRDIRANAAGAMPARTQPGGRT